MSPHFRNRLRGELLDEIARHNQALAEHRQLAGLHLGTPAMQVVMARAELVYWHREAARQELALLRSSDHVVAP